MQVSIPLEDFTRLLAAADFGVKQADGRKAHFVVRAWSKTVERLSSMPLNDGRTQEQRDQAAFESLSKQIEQHGAD